MKILFLFYLLIFNLVLAARDNQFFSEETLPPDIRCSKFSECLSLLFMGVLRALTSLATALAIIFITWAGILYITKGSSGEKSKEIHKRIIWAVVGLIVALLSYALVIFLEKVIREGSV